MSEFVPDTYKLQELAVKAREILNSFPVGIEDPTERAELLDSWLRWSQSDAKDSRMRWSFLAESGAIQDRDGYVLELWRSIANREFLMQHVKQELGSWDHYERHFFGWFLSRFDLRSARGMFSTSRFVAWFNPLLAVVSLLLAGVALYPTPALNTSFVYLIVIALVFLAGLAMRLPLYVYAHSLSPRLAATVGIGYLFLANAPQVVRIVYESGRNSRQLWAATLLLLACALFYIMLHIWRRVHPPLRSGALLLRGLDLWALALSYAAIGAMLAGPILFSPSMLYGPTDGIHPPRLVAPHLHHLALVAAIALNLGVILQLAWDEKPLTEPL
jgi:hypothetical protein